MEYSLGKESMEWNSEEIWNFGLQGYVHTYEVHRDQVPLYQGYGAKRSSEAPVRGNIGAYRRCVDQLSCESEARVL